MRATGRERCGEDSELDVDWGQALAQHSGGDINRGFCGVCGSPVVARFSRMPDLMGIPAGSLDDPSWHKPTMDMFTSSAQPWDYMNPDLPKFPEAPDSKG